MCGRRETLLTSPALLSFSAPLSLLITYTAEGIQDTVHAKADLMESKQCESCLREDAKVCAEFYCFDCEEPLCSACLKNHKKNKFLMSHHTVDLDFIDIFPTSTLSKITHCAKHGDGRVDLFCTDHEALCCRHCMTESHRSCKSILPIDIAAREIKSSPLSSMLTQDLTLFLQTLNTLITNREETGRTFEKDVEELRKNVQITAIAVTNDNRLILCNRYSNRLLVYSDSGKFLQDCTVLCKPWDIAILPDGNRGVVTLPLENSIQFLNISNMTTDKEQISIHNKCHGVAVVSDFIVVGANRELYILAMDGSIRTRVQVPGQLIYFLHGGDNNSVYYTDYHCLYHVGLDGEEIFRYNNPDLKVPEGIARDNQGYLCVIGRGSQNVHRVGDNGRAIDIVLNRDDGVILPWAITFNNKGTKTFISTHDGKCISVYDIHTYRKQKGM
ncbi:unnamed protein product [Mytilus coruscus]|uniref:B box-type domain-containing protein n=1 Tax=Mytilus coruscus TaxID=42192 RepID=A0A6J8CVQ8_MYTCO|nr:unnamed protein product [Mytilus coruscus]